MNKQPEITAATRQRILDAFWDLYAQSPVSQIRIKEITAAAGLNRCTFYQYFTDIYDILHQEEDRIIGEIVDRRANLNGISDSAVFMAGIAEMYRVNGRYLCILTGENGDPNFPLLLQRRLFSAFVRLEHAPESVATSIIFSFGLNGLLAAFRTWYLSEPRLPAESFLGLAESMITRGIPAALTPYQTP